MPDLIFDYLPPRAENFLYHLKEVDTDNSFLPDDQFLEYGSVPGNKLKLVQNNDTNYSSLFSFINFMRRSSNNSESLELTDIINAWANYNSKDKNNKSSHFENCDPTILTSQINYSGRIISRRVYSLAEDEKEEHFTCAHLALTDTTIDVIVINVRKQGQDISIHPDPRILHSQPYEPVEKTIYQD